jgi:signal transduction histidine kinase
MPGDLGPDLANPTRVSPLGIAAIVIGSGMAISIAVLASLLVRRHSHERELKRSFAQLRALAARVQGAREDERKAVAREIHDELGQALTSIKIDLSALVRDDTRARAQPKRAESMLKLLDDTIQSVRRLATQLRPSILDHLGLAAAIEWAAAEFEERTGVKCEFQLPETELPTSSDQVTALFRIFQETLTNVSRHAEATGVKVRLYADQGAVCLQVEDNGQGMDPGRLPDTHALGIFGMRERALLLGGELTIRSARGAGTMVEVRIPAVAVETRS